jgi:hypothetical protein
MFADAGLATLSKRSPKHPAVQRYHRLRAFVSDGVTYPDEVELLREITGGLLDGLVWADVPSDKDYWSFIPSVDARERVRQSILDPEQFHDVIAEVFFWSWLREQIQSANLVEEVALPDIVVDRGSDLEVWAEVKRVRLGKNPERVGDVIKKANSQLKNANPERVGIVFLSIERAVQRVALDDRIPDDVQRYLHEVERKLASDTNRSVGRIVVSWDDFAVDTEPGRGITYTFRRRSETRTHGQPRGEVPLAVNVTHVEKMITISGEWPAETEEENSGHGPRLTLGNAVVGPRFREFNASWDGIRPQHALEALSEPDAVWHHQFRFGAGEQLLITRRVTGARKPFTMLLIVRLLGDGRREIGEAYRLYDDSDMDRQLHHHPLAAFEALISRYSIPFLFPSPFGSVSINFLRAARLPLPSADPRAVMQLVQLPAGVHALSGASLMRVVSGVPPVCEIEWLWFLDAERYRTDVRERLR